MGFWNDQPWGHTKLVWWQFPYPITYLLKKFTEHLPICQTLCYVLTCRPFPGETFCTWIWKTDNKQELGYILYELWKMYAQGAECTDKGYLNQNRNWGRGMHLKKDVRNLDPESPKHSNVIITDSGNPLPRNSFFTSCVTEETGNALFYFLMLSFKNSILFSFSWMRYFILLLIM